MKFTIALTLVIVLSCTSAVLSKQETLRSLFNEVTSEDPCLPEAYKKFVENVDKDCLKDKMKLDKNGDKVYHLAQTIGVLYGSYLKCLRQDLVDEFVAIVINLFSNQVHIFHANMTECFQYKLQQIDSSSNLIKNFKTNQMKNSEEICEKSIESVAGQFFKPSFEDEFGSISDFTCDAFSKKEVEKIALDFKVTGQTIADQDVRNAEIQKIIQVFKSKWEQVYDCFIAKL